MIFCLKKFLFILVLTVIFVLVSAPVTGQTADTEETKKIKDFKSQYPSTSHKYRGVVTMDGDGVGTDELYVDFGSAGLWVYHGSWTKLSPLNPQWIFAFEYSSTHYLVADFGTAGLWRWNYSGSWTGTWVRISNSNAVSGFATDDDNDGNQELHINFSGLGLWRYDLGRSPQWLKINSLNSSGNSLRMDTFLAGHEEGAHSFSTAGLWRYYYPNNWAKLNDLEIGDDSVSAEVDGGAAEELIVDFDAAGIWALDGATHTWNKLAGGNGAWDMRAVRFEGSPDYEILVSFNSYDGLWWWNHGPYPGAWFKINSATPDCDGGFCEPFDPNGLNETLADQEVAVDFGSLGLWIYDFTDGSWTKINSADPHFMVAWDLYNIGRKEGLVVDFGPGVGLWLYDGWSVISWTKLNALSPDGVN